MSIFAETVRATFDLLPDPVFILQPRTLAIVYANQVAEEVTGWSEHELHRLCLPELHPGYAQEAIVADLDRFEASPDATFEYQGVLRLTSDALRIIAMKVSRASFDQQPYLLAIGRDISDQLDIEQHIREDAILYRSLIAALSDLMFRITREGIYRDFHIPETSNLASPPLDAIIGHDVQDVVPQDVTDTVMPVIDQVVQSGEIGTVEYSIQEPHGLRHYEARFVPSLADEIIAVVRDITDRKREAEMLRYNEKMARALVNASIDTAVLIDLDTNILAINDTGAERLGGFNAEAMIGTSIFDYMPANVAKFRHSFADQLLTKKEPIQFTDTRADYIFDNRVSPILDENGNISFIAIFARNITKERHSQDTLERQNQLFQGVAEATRRLLNPAPYKEAMQTALAILGNSTGVDRIFICQNHQQTKHDDQHLRIRCVWQHATIQGTIPMPDIEQPRWLERGGQRWHRLLSDGGIIQSTVQALPPAERKRFDAPNAPLSILVVPIFVDHVFWGFISLDDCKHEREWTDAEISALQTMASSLGSAIARQKIEESLREKSEFIDTVRTIGNTLGLTHNPDDVLEQLLIEIKPVIEYDTASAMLLEGDTARIVAVQGFEKYGFEADAIINTTIPVSDVDYMQLMLETHEPCVSPDTTDDTTWRPLNKPTWIKSWLGAPIIFDDSILGFFAVDSTQRGFYTEEHLSKIHYFGLQAGFALKTARDVVEIESLEHVKSEIIRIASHDLRTPLTRLRSVIQQLSDHAGDHCTPKERQALQIALAAIRDMDHIISNILSLERIEAHQRDAQPVYWQDLIKNALTDTEEELTIHAHTLTLDIATDLPVTRGNPFKLERAISNLIHNAIKYTPSGGHIKVCAEVRPYGLQSTIAVEVKDDGIGIPPEHKEQLFQPFYRAQQSGTEHVPGTGLGLSMTKTVIEEHNGSVYFDSVPGQGSVFGFWVPV